MARSNNELPIAVANNSSIITDKLPDHGTIPKIAEFIVLTKQSAEIMAKSHGALKVILPEFKAALDEAFYSFLDFDQNMKKAMGQAVASDGGSANSQLSNTLHDPSKLVQTTENPQITHQNNIDKLMAVVKKMQRAITKEKFQAPLFWGAVTLSILVLSAGAAMFAMPAYVAAGFVCIFAGAIGLFITTLQMRSGFNHPYDKKFFKHCEDVKKYLNRPLEGAGAVPEFIPARAPTGV